MHHRSSSIGSLALAALLPVVACGGRPAGTSGTSAQAGSGAAPSDQALLQSKDVPAGLDLVLSNGKAGPPAFDRAKLAPAKALSDAEAGALLGRLKPIASEPTDQQAFALRPRSQPPPRTGQTIKSSFPPPAASQLPPPAIASGGELRVLRYIPEGNVPLAPELTVTFSQPMIAVTSQAD